MCSVGKFLEDICEGEVFAGSSLSDNDRFLLEVRSGLKVVLEVCKRHKQNFCSGMYDAKRTKCCRPFEEINCKGRDLRIISVDQYFIWKQFCLNPIAPGQKLCSLCRKKLAEKVAEAEAPMLLPDEISYERSPQSQPPVLQAMALVSFEKSVQKSQAEPVFSEEKGNSSQDLFEGCDVLQQHSRSDLGEQTISDSFSSITPEEPHSDAHTQSSGNEWSSPHERYYQNVCEEISAMLNVEIDISTNNNQKYRLQKLFEIQAKVKMPIFRAGGKKEPTKMKNVIVPIDWEEACSHIISQIKKKLSETEDMQTKINLLSVLPVSWTEQQLMNEFQIGRKLAHRAKELVAQQGLLPQILKKKGSAILNEEVVEQVVKFYEDSEVSREMPGKKDCKSVRIGGKRVTKQKRLVLMNLREAFEHFKCNVGTQIGFSKFAELRPAHCVLAGSAGTHSVCVCVIHENFKLMVSGAHLDNVDPEGKEDSKRSFSLENCVQRILCENPTDDCFFHECKSCPTEEVLREELEVLFDERGVENVTYNQWTKTDRCSLETVILTTEDFIDRFLELILSVVLHDFMSKKQSQYFKETKANLKPGEVAVVADFSENYSFVVQDAVQGFHWNNKQATIHLFSCYYKAPEKNEVECISFVCISDCLTHNTVAVHAFQKQLVTFLKERVSGLKKILYFSDGAASQYKNRKNVRNIAYHEQDFGIPAEWHYFATAHGKGPLNGLGGTLKRLAARASLQKIGGSLIATPIDLYIWAREHLKGISFVFVSLEDIEEHAKTLKTRFDEAVGVPGIMKVHSIIPAGTDAVIVKSYSNCPVERQINIRPPEQNILPAFVDVENVDDPQIIVDSGDGVGNPQGSLHEKQITNAPVKQFSASNRGRGIDHSTGRKTKEQPESSGILRRSGRTTSTRKEQSDTQAKPKKPRRT